MWRRPELLGDPVGILKLVLDVPLEAHSEGVNPAMAQVVHRGHSAANPARHSGTLPAAVRTSDAASTDSANLSRISLVGRPASPRSFWLRSICQYRRNAVSPLRSRVRVCPASTSLHLQRSSAEPECIGRSGSWPRPPARPSVGSPAEQPAISFRKRRPDPPDGTRDTAASDRRDHAPARCGPCQNPRLRRQTCRSGA